MATQFKNLKENDIAKINQRVMKAFEENFEPIEIERDVNVKHFYVNQGNSWFFSCATIEELNGWMYGCVQANNKIIKVKRG